MESALNDINNVDKYGMTQLTRASKYGHIDIVKLLLDWGSDPNYQNEDRSGRTALMWASLFGRTDIVKLLLARGADSNIVTRYGETAIMCVSLFGHIEILELLLDKGSDPNIVNEHGETAIMWATYRGHTDIVKVINDHIALQNALQNLAMAKSMNSLSSSLQYLDYDIMKEIMICKRTYDHGVHMRMKEDN